MFEVIAPSNATRVGGKGCGKPGGQTDRYPNPAPFPGRAVAFSTYASKPATLNCGKLQGPPPGKGWTWTSTWPVNGPDVDRVSRMRQGVTVYSAKLPGIGGAKYPLMSINIFVS